MSETLRGALPGGRVDLGRALRRLARGTERLEVIAIAECGLPRVQAHALLAVAIMARPAMAMVARELDLAPSTVTRLLDPLVRRGLVRREADPADRRVIVLALTGPGRQVARQLGANLERAYARLASTAGSGGGRRLASAAGELVTAIERAGAAEPKRKRASPKARPRR